MDKNDKRLGRRMLAVCRETYPVVAKRAEAAHVSRQTGIPTIVGPFQVVFLWALKLLIDGRGSLSSITDEQVLS